MLGQILQSDSEVAHSSVERWDTFPVHLVILIGRCHGCAKIFIMKWVTVTRRLPALPGTWRRDLSLSLRRVGWVNFESNVIIGR